MPELPDITIYLEALERRLLGQELIEVRLSTPFLLRTAVPPLDETRNRKVIGLRRIGKRIAIQLERDLWLVLHLMIAGRLHWHAAPAQPKGKQNLAGFRFRNGTFTLTEAETKKRASMHLAQGTESLRAHDPGGVEVLACTLNEFAAALALRNHTLKRALTDPYLFSGIGNAYSDEILHRAGMSPVALTKGLDHAQTERLYHAARHTLTDWIERLRQETGENFPENVTAFRPGMAVHGKFGRPCPTCGSKVQRIRYASNETNYCPRCQTGGKLLADRSLSTLLKKDWPKTPEELEAKRRHGG